MLTILSLCAVDVLKGKRSPPRWGLRIVRQVKRAPCRREEKMSWVSLFAQELLSTLYMPAMWGVSSVMCSWEMSIPGKGTSTSKEKCPPRHHNLVDKFFIVDKTWTNWYVHNILYATTLVKSMFSTTMFVLFSTSTRTAQFTFLYDFTCFIILCQRLEIAWTKDFHIFLYLSASFSLPTNLPHSGQDVDKTWTLSTDNASLYISRNYFCSAIQNRI